MEVKWIRLKEVGHQIIGQSIKTSSIWYELCTRAKVAVLHYRRSKNLDHLSVCSLSLWPTNRKTSTRMHDWTFFFFIGETNFEYYTQAFVAVVMLGFYRIPLKESHSVSMTPSQNAFSIAQFRIYALLITLLLFNRRNIFYYIYYNYFLDFFT